MLRASKAGIWANCPGSTQIATLQVDPDPVTLEGTLIHALTQSKGTGQPLDNITGLVVTGEFMDLAQAAAEYALGLVDPGADHWETPLTYGDVLSGTCDFYGYNSQTATLQVVEFKFGYRPVPAVWNWQLLCYLLMLQPFGNAERVALHVYQPRDFSDPVKVWEFSVSEWPGIKKWIEQAIQNATRGEQCQTGMWCQVCPSRVFCPAFQQQAAALLETVSAASTRDLPPSAVSARHKYLLRAQEIINSAVKGSEELIFYQLEHGIPVPDWMIGTGRGRREWTGTVDQLKTLGAMFGIELTQTVPISITAASKLPAAKSGALDSVLKYREGSKKLVPYDPSEAKEKFKP